LGALHVKTISIKTSISVEAIKLKLLHLILLALVIMLAGIAGAEDIQATDETKPDSRLDQKITYEAKGELLHRVLDELSAKTNVTMTCGNNEKDWQVRDRKVIIFVKDMPLSDIQKHLADVLHFTWTQSGKEGEYTYKLSADLKARKEEELLRVKAKEAEKQKLIARRQAALADLDSVLKIDPSDMEKLRTEDPLMYFLAKKPIGKAMAKLVNAVPEMRAALIEGQELKLNAHQLSPAGRAAAKEFIESYVEFSAAMDPSGTYDTYDEPGAIDSFDEINITINEDMMYEPDYVDPTEECFVGTVEVYCEGYPFAMMPLIDAKHPAGKVIGRALALVADGVPPDLLENQVEMELQAALKQLVSEMMPIDPLPEDPTLEKTIKLEPEDPDELCNVLGELHKKGEYQIVSDYFRYYPEYLYIEQVSLTLQGKLRDVLQSIQKRFEKKIKVTDKLVLLEDRKWFEKRACEIPEEWLQDWQTMIEERTLSFEDLVDIACLTDEQLEYSIYNDSMLSPFSWILDGDSLHLLRLYAVLNSSQKRALKSKDGLHIARLGSKQKPYFDYLLSQGYREAPSHQPYYVLYMENPDPGFEYYYFVLIDLNAPPDPDTGEVYQEVDSWSFSMKGILEDCLGDYYEEEYDEVYDDYYEEEYYEEEPVSPGEYDDYLNEEGNYIE